MPTSGGPDNPGYALIVFWQARPEHVAEVSSILYELARCTREEPGCINFLVHADTSDDCTFVLYELYSDEDAFKTHRSTGHFKTLVLERAVQMLVRRDLTYCVPLFSRSAFTQNGATTGS